MKTLSPWRQAQRQAFSSLTQLADYLELPLSSFDTSSFPLLVPKRLADKIEKGNRHDPLLLQFAPIKQPRPTGNLPQFRDDPVGDEAARKAPRLLHKYRGRALLVTTAACAMNCRYCFRQHFSYAEGKSDYAEELHYLDSTPSISEVILSGGDPLSLSNEALCDLLAKLEAIPHLKRLRFHSRFPVGIPERIDEGFLELLGRSRLQVIFVCHINHPREIDSQLLEAMGKLRSLGIPLLNQAVLLRGVNDNLETLHELCETLADNGILPYYLHQLDQVSGAESFEVREEEGLRLIKQLEASLSGYAVPRYVREIEGEPSKTPL